MSALSRFGLTVDLPRGWEAAIFRRPPSPGEETHPVMHIASFPLPPDRGDFGGGAVEVMKARDVFFALLEDDPQSAATALYAGRSMPRVVVPAAFNPATLQRVILGHAGMQVFFTEAGRAFCLYVVLGSWALTRLLVPRVNAVLSRIRIEDR